MKHRRAELAHQHRKPSLGIIGQHGNGRAVILDFALEHMAVRQLDAKKQELAPALMQGLDAEDAVACHAGLLPMTLVYNARGPEPARRAHGT